MLESRHHSTWSVSAPKGILQLKSHGEGSSLLEHTWQVAHCAKTQWELVTIICHDALKAHPKWQAYAEKFIKGTSPFGHAAAGGVLAYFVLKSTGHPHEECLAALHTNSAHHGNLASLPKTETIAEIVHLQNPTCQGFIKLALREWANIKPEETTQAFEHALALINEEGQTGKKRELRHATQEQRMKAAFLTRDLLGRLCLFDHRSAANQDPQKKEEFLSVLLCENTFTPRLTKKKFGTNYAIDKHRQALFEQVVQMPTGHKYYCIPAPTGLGKSNACITLAENLCAADKKEKLIYTAALTSIGDQTFSDYFGKEGNNAQIWNFKRRETAGNREDENLTEARELATLESPFGRSLNVTTFNQVALALLHPHRHYAINSVALRNAVILFDEYHILPSEILQAILETIDSRNDLQAVFMSATPAHEDLWEGRDVITLNPDFLRKLQNTEEISQRRKYRRAPKELTTADLAEIIKSHENPQEDLLVMVNLIGQGTIPIARALGLKANPWKRWGRNPHNRPLTWLDSTVPPILLQPMIQKLKEGRKTGQILLCTPILKAGVDLEFDTGWEDYSSPSGTGQTGGRIGRNEGNWNILNCFCLQTTEKTSRELLHSINQKEIQKKFGEFEESRLGKIILKRLEEKHYLDGEFFKLWQGDKTDEDLLNADKEISRMLPSLPNRILPLILKPNPTDFGLTLQSWEPFANIYGEQNQPEAIILPSEIDPARLEKVTRTNCKEKIRIEQNYTVRFPLEFAEMLHEENVWDTGHTIGDTPVWQERINQI